MRAKEQHDPPPEEDPESACYRTTTTDGTSEIKCVDVCVEFPSSSDDDANKNNNNNSRVCRSKPYEEETSDSKFLACERACLDAHFASVSLKFRGDEEKMKEYESLRKRECESGCLRAFFPEEKEWEEEEEDSKVVGAFARARDWHPNVRFSTIKHTKSSLRTHKQKD